MNDPQNWQNQAWQQAQPVAQPQPQSQPVPSAPSQQPVYANQAPVQAKKRGWIVAVVVIICLTLLMVSGMVSCSNAFSSSIQNSFSGSLTSSSLDAVYEDSVAIINIDGTIQYDGSTASPEGLKAQLDKAESNPRIIAIVLRVNSGGGVATAGEEMAGYVKDFSKPIVVSSASMNASAAYEISSQTDYIYTAKTTAIGSIGTAMSITDLSGLYDKLGIRIEDITSAESKDSSYGNRPLTEEEREYYQNMVNQINETFIATVAEGRSMGVEDVRALATGLTFTGMEAVDNGIADEIGTLEDACEKAANLANRSSYKTITLKNSSSFSMLDLLNILGQSSSDEEFLNRIKELENDGSLSR